MTRRTYTSSVRHEPPDPGVLGAILLRLLQRNPTWAWPVSEIVRASGLSDRAVGIGLLRLLDLGLITRRSRDTVIRVVVTPAGARWRPRPRG